VATGYGGYPPGSRVGIKSIGFGLYHNITHNEPGDQPMCTAAVKFFMKELVVLVEALRQIPEGAGTLLDNCAIAATTDCTNPKVHGAKDFPLLVIGRGGGRLRSGVHVRGTGENSCRVLLGLARTTGATIPSFGEGTARVTEPIAGIEI